MFRLLMQPSSGQLKYNKYLDVRTIWDLTVLPCVVQLWWKNRLKYLNVDKIGYITELKQVTRKL
jgi:hypothetical protein